MGFAASTLWISAGVIVWAAHFAAIYGFTALACARGLPQAVAPVVATATVLALAALVPVLARGIRRRGEFEGWLSAAIAGFALVAIAWEGMTVLFVAPCG